MKTKTITSILCLVLLSLCGTLKAQTTSKTIDLAKNEMIISYCDENDTPNPYSGSGKEDSINVASLYPKAMMTGLKGQKINRIRFCLYGNAVYLTNVFIFITNKLGETNILRQDVDFFQAGWNDITLDNPYQITGDSIFVGYSVTVTKAVDMYKDGCPIGVNYITPAPNALYRNFQTWHKGLWEVDNNFGALMLQCITTTSKNNAAQIGNVSYNRSETGKDVTISSSLTNTSGHAINNIDVEYKVGGETKTVNVPFDSPAKYYYSAKDFSFTAKAPQAPGRYDMQVKIAKINGESNEEADKTSNIGTVIDVEKSYDRQTIMELTAATWDGWSIRSDLGTKMLLAKYPSQIIPIITHWSSEKKTDPMQCDAYKPLLNITGYGVPMSVFNRVSDYVCDPYRGTGADEAFNSYKVFDKAQARIAEGKLTLTSNYADDAKTQINVTAAATFGYSYTSTPYRMAYALVEDSVTGTTKDKYYQVNFYNRASYNTSFNNAADKLPSEFKEYLDKPYTIEGMVFNNVAVGIYNFNGIEGSLEGNIELGVEKQHSTTLTLPQNIKNKNNVRVVAMLVDAVTGEIVNAVSAKIGKSTGTGVLSLQDNAFTAKVVAEQDNLNIVTNATGTVTVALYNTSGSLITSKAFSGSTTIATSGLKGIYIVRITNGNDVVVKKISL